MNCSDLDLATQMLNSLCCWWKKYREHSLQSLQQRQSYLKAIMQTIHFFMHVDYPSRLTKKSPIWLVCIHERIKIN